MRCPNCGYMQEDQDICPECGYKLNNVQLLTPEERENFTGITIEQEEQEPSHAKEYSRQYGQYKTRIVWTGGGLLTTVIFIGIILLLLFFALPIAIASLIVFTIYMVFKKR